uniref:Uncharacterized protein n=1 Tax=Anguilla anguilla TaxID=7936 RepID=A0A0E9X619_ANGAN
MYVIDTHAFYIVRSFTVLAKRCDFENVSDIHFFAHTGPNFKRLLLKISFLMTFS